MSGRRLSLFLALGLALVGCSAAPVTIAPASPSALPTPTPTATVVALSPSLAATPTPSPTVPPIITASPSGGPNGSVPPPPIDPCSLLTSAEASVVNGITYGAGVSHVLDNGAVECVWQNSSPPASITLQVLVAPSVSEAEVAYAEAQAMLNGFNVAQVTGYGDEAVIARATQSGISTGGIYVRAGSTFFDVVYLQGTVPSDTQLTDAATLVLGRLP
jgi:hypothetical protein